MHELLVESAGYRQTALGDLGAIRLAMGEKMVLGLEFFLAGDIIQTIVVPTWETLRTLGGIVVIETSSVKHHRRP